jgi:hypothetical protein
MNTGVPKIIKQWNAWTRAGAIEAGPMFGSKVCVPSESDDPSLINLPSTGKTVRGSCYISQYNALIDTYVGALDEMKVIKGDDFIPTNPVFEAHLNVNAANALVDEACVRESFECEDGYRRLRDLPEANTDGGGLRIQTVWRYG